MQRISTEELQSLADAFGLNRIAGGRCSRLFLFQLYACTFRTHALGDTPKVIAEVAHLEGMGGPSRTKSAEAFKRAPLLGLKKKHYLVGGLASVAQITLLGAGKKHREFRRIAERNYNPATGSAPAVIAKKIADEVTKLYADRSGAQSLTGNWIVFAEHGGKNFYLCLALHDEGDNVIAGRIKDICWTEFPFLESLMAARS